MQKKDLHTHLSTHSMYSTRILPLIFIVILDDFTLISRSDIWRKFKKIFNIEQSSKAWYAHWSERFWSRNKAKERRVIHRPPFYGIEWTDSKKNSSITLIRRRSLINCWYWRSWSRVNDIRVWSMNNRSSSSLSDWSRISSKLSYRYLFDGMIGEDSSALLKFSSELIQSVEDFLYFDNRLDSIQWFVRQRKWEEMLYFEN